MSDVVLTKSVRQNLLSLQNTTSLLDRTQERLATGKKVNSALDNPTNFFTAAGLDSRASDISNLLDGIANGVQVLKAADTGITSISKLLDSAKATGRQALQAPSAFTTKAKVESSATNLPNVTSDNLLGGTPATFKSNATFGTIATTDFDDQVKAGAASTQNTTLANLNLADASETIVFQLGTDSADNITLTAGTDFNAGTATISDIVTALNNKITSSASSKIKNVTVTSDATSVTLTGGSTNFSDNFQALKGTAVTSTSTPVLNSAVTTVNAKAADTVTLSLDGGSALTFTRVAGTPNTDNRQFNTFQDLADAINKSDAGAKVVASVATDGKFQINAKNAVTTFSLGGTNNNGTANTATEGLKFDSTTAAGKPTNTLASKALTLQIGSGVDLKSRTVTFGTGANQVNTLDELNSQINEIGLTASVDTTGKLKIETTNENATKTFSVSGSAANAAALAANSSNPVFGGPGDTQRQNLVKDFNNFLTQIDKLAADASFNGTNLLQGDDLDLIFNETNTSSLKVKGVTYDTAGLGLTSAASNDFDDASTINKYLSKLDTASITLRSQAQKFGSNLSVVQTRQDFSKSLINVLQTGSSNLTLANTNEEAANVNALQTRQSLSVSALSLANQSNQAVLQLLR